MQPFDTWLMLAKGINIVASSFDVNSFPMHRTANVMTTALQVLLRGVVNGPGLLSHVVPFADYRGVIETFEGYRSTSRLKTVVDFRSPGDMVGRPQEAMAEALAPTYAIN
jgi:L-iditol 2-dehydrogenase/threonine 3-dehydrogenase